MTSNYILEFIDVQTQERDDRISPIVPRIGERVRILDGFYRVEDIDWVFKSNPIWTEREQGDYRPIISIFVYRIPTPEF